MIIELDEWRARYLLEALRVCQSHWSATAKDSEDEDLQADYGNDIVRLSILYDYIQDNAIEAFGSKIEEFSRAPISLTVPNSRDDS